MNSDTETQAVNEIIKLIFSHRTIRKFDPAVKLSKEEVTLIVKAGQRASTSCSGQMYSVVHITNPNLRKQVNKACKNISMISSCGDLFIILVDLHRLDRIVKHTGGVMRDWKILALTVGIFDAGLFAQNMALAAESLGYGIGFAGTCGDGAEELIRLLKLPPRVYPIAGLAIGKPLEDPPTRPRIPTQYVLHENTYHEFTETDLDHMISVMSEKLEQEGYYKRYTNRNNYTWKDHMKRKFGGEWLERVDKEKRKGLQAQGLL